MMQYPLLAALPPPGLDFIKILFQIWYTILSRLPCPILSCVRFVSNLYSNMMQHTLVAALPPPALVFFKPTFKYDRISSPRCPHPLLYSLLTVFLLEYDAISSASCRASSCARSLLTYYSNMMRCPLLAALRPPALVPYWSPIRIWCTVLSWLPCLILSCVRFLSNPYWNMIQCLL